MQKFIFFTFLMLLIAVSADAENNTNLYLFTKYVDMKNTKSNEYVEFTSNENVAGFGLQTWIISNKKDKFDVALGFGRSKTNIDLFYNYKLMNTSYHFEKNLKYNTNMYIFDISYMYKISKNISIELNFEQNKNVLKRNVYTFKLSYEF